MGRQQALLKAPPPPHPPPRPSAHSQHLFIYWTAALDEVLEITAGEPGLVGRPTVVTPAGCPAPPDVLSRNSTGNNWTCDTGSIRGERKSETGKSMPGPDHGADRSVREASSRHSVHLPWAFRIPVSRVKAVTPGSPRLNSLS